METSFARPAFDAQGAERSEKGKMLTPGWDSSPFLKKFFPSGFPLAANGLGDLPAAENGADFPAAARPVFCIQYLNTKAPAGAAHSSGRRAMRFASGGCVGKIAVLLFAPPIFSRISVARSPPGA